MRAVLREEYSWSSLRVGEAPVPEPGRGQVRLSVQAAAIDRGTCHLVDGTPRAVRLAFGLRRPRQPVLGRDVAGVIDAVGSDVSEWTVGDEVLGTAPGALAEFAVARADRLVRRPEGLSPDAAAALPISGSTALQALVDHGHLQPGQRVLVVGASGGVGSYAVQIAVAHGAEVVAVCSAAKAEHVRALGASEVIDYATATVPEDASFDVLVDVGGARPVATLRRAVRPEGRLVLVGAEGGGALLGGVGRQAVAALASIPRKQKAAFFVSSEDADHLQRLVDLVTDGQVQPLLDRVVGIDEAPDAIRYVRDGHATGKVVVRIDQ
jgi:NADPH:quinone reductase-like Zn-dependent oxidoreductase